MNTPRISMKRRVCGFVLMTLSLAGIVGTQFCAARGQDPPRPTPTPVADGADAQGAPAPAGDQTDPRAASLDARPDPRGVRRAGGSRPGRGTGDPQAASRADPGNAARSEAGRSECPVDPGLLELGRLA